MKIPLLLLFLFGFSLQSLATLQMPEKMNYKGKATVFRELYPFEEYRKKNNISLPGGTIESSALWRGYIGTYAVRANYLVLEDLEVNLYNSESNQTRWQSIIGEMPEPVHHLRIEWFSGILVLPYSDMASGEAIGEAPYLGGYGGREHYDHYFVLEFKNGLLTKEEDLTYKEFLRYRKRQFETFKQTEKYKKERATFEKEQKEREAYRQSEEYKQSRWYKMEQEFGIRFKQKEWFDEYIEETVFYRINKLAD